jgi:transglutaminase-like putative cysteine protease
MGVSLLFVYLLAAHRNYHVDAPRQISSLAWKLEILQKFRVEPQHLFLAIGSILVLSLGIYFFAADRRSLFGQNRREISSGKLSRISTILSPLLALVALIVFSWTVNKHYSEDLSRVSNGVGASQNEAGKSNLGFHEATSSTKQPAALLRLEGDYENNPWAPMLYLREGALSAFGETEIVKAVSGFDSDIPSAQIGESFLSHIDEPGEHREKVTQSIYLLSEHTAPFAIDFPRRIAQIKNPYPERFRLAYQALSYAPTEAIEDLMNEPVGDSSWDSNTWEHYLRAPGSKSKGVFQKSPEEIFEIAGKDDPVLDEHGEDLRYMATAKVIVGNADTAVSQAALIITYLSEQSIYTRQPGHQVTDKGDPVAPYLFSDKKRGYCVHFAHAAVYMMRLLGIPSRIGTGYLTDLNYAKDGHVLLQLGDRHAWPEVYIEGRGWVVFDITPAQAENEEPIVPDENLLDDLMNKLNPVEELLDPIAEEIDTGSNYPLIERVLAFNFFGELFGLLLVAYILAKLWLRYAYRFASNPKQKVKYAYTAFASTMCDHGHPRFQGETREEYSRRLLQSVGVRSKEITKFLEIASYAKGKVLPDPAEVDRCLEKVIESHKEKSSTPKRVLAFFNPVSLAKLNVW